MKGREKMFVNKLNKPWFRIVLALVVVAGGVAALQISATPAQAHCDSKNGPVAEAAHQALSASDVKLILPYVKPESEVELTAAFKETLAVRKTGKTARELADRYFVETAIRLHRTGEGAAYTGVTGEAVPESILLADRAMASGSTDEVYKDLEAAIHKAVEAKYGAVVEARAEATRLNTVEAHRKRVEAELMFEKFMYELTTFLSSTEALTEGHAH
jgi:hypothetical protein